MHESTWCVQTEFPTPCPQNSGVLIKAASPGFCPVNKKTREFFQVFLNFYDLALPVARGKKLQKLQKKNTKITKYYNIFQNIMEVKFLKVFVPRGHPQHPGQMRIQNSANTRNTFPVTRNQNTTK